MTAATPSAPKRTRHRTRRTASEMERGHRVPQAGNSRSWRQASWMLPLDRDDWLPRRACRDTDPDVFCPTTKKANVGGPKRLAAVAPALAVCAKCAVRPQCASEALRLGVAHGVVAGVDLGDESRKFEQTEEDRALLAAIADSATS